MPTVNTEKKKITFYIVRLDGELQVRETPIYFPKAKVSQGRTKAEDDRDYTYDIMFNHGYLELDEDDFRVEWMRVYNSGGTFEYEGKPVRVVPNTNMFKITEEDPTLKVKMITQNVEVKVDVQVMNKEFVDLLSVDQLEAFANTNKIDISAVKKTKAAMVEFLASTGHIK
jgi:hypothetical protein